MLGVSLDGWIFSTKGLAEPNAEYLVATRNEDEAAFLKVYRRMLPKRRQGLLDVLDADQVYFPRLLLWTYMSAAVTRAFCASCVASRAQSPR